MSKVDEHRAALEGLTDWKPYLDEHSGLPGPRGNLELVAACGEIADRRSPGVRTLRQALGYGWSVVVAALPSQGLPAFSRMQASDDPDVAWIVRENNKKARLERGASEPRQLTGFAPVADAVLLLTAFQRAERFGDGNIEGAITSGLIQAALARVRRRHDAERGPGAQSGAG